jgi:hypothetical protein
MGKGKLIKAFDDVKTWIPIAPEKSSFNRMMFNAACKGISPFVKR